MIAFNKPAFTGAEEKYVSIAVKSEKLSGDGFFTRKCEKWFEKRFGCKRALMTPSCTAALEMAALIIGVKLGDEIIMPSYTFVSTANAFALRGAKIVFVDIDPETMCIDVNLVEKAITVNTVAIVPVHYAGISCDMKKLVEIAEKNKLFLIEDAAQAIMSKFSCKQLGTFGHLSTYSFHETKNITSGGEGGILLINDERLIERAEVIREKGTNRNKFFRGEVDKYTWTSLGGSYLASELQAAYLWGQLENVERITSFRHNIWNGYKKELENIKDLDFIRTPEECEHNAHLFAIKAKNNQERSKLLSHLKENGIMAVFHYNPLHSSFAGKKMGTFYGQDIYTTFESERLIRLPIWFGMDEKSCAKVIEKTLSFFGKN